MESQVHITLALSENLGVLDTGPPESQKQPAGLFFPCERGTGKETWAPYEVVGATPVSKCWTSTLFLGLNSDVLLCSLFINREAWGITRLRQPLAHIH